MKKILAFVVLIVCTNIFANAFAQKNTPSKKSTVPKKNTTAQKNTPTKKSSSVNYSSSSYNYKNAIGIKTLGISFKKFVKPNKAIELVASYWGYRSTLAFSYQFHNNIGNSPGFKWYIGPAAYVGMYDYGYNNTINANINTENSFLVGAGGIIGLDYKFKGSPFNISLDWQPSVEFILGEDNIANSGIGFGAYWVGAAFRYTF
jgi:uncharacterized protein YxeA